jgi:DNA polymerase IIIc chi subunit
MQAEPIPPITLPPLKDANQEKQWLEKALHNWLNEEFIPEAINDHIAKRATQIYIRQRLEGENDLGSLVIAIVTEMQSFNFRDSFYSEFAIANAISDLILDSLGIDRCCGG